MSYDSMQRFIADRRAQDRDIREKAKHRTCATCGKPLHEHRYYVSTCSGDCERARVDERG